MWDGERKNQAPRKQDALGTSATLPMTPRAHQACVSPLPTISSSLILIFFSVWRISRTS